MNKKTAILIATLALSLMSATALGVLYITRQVEFQASILVSGDFQIFEDPECTIELLAFDFGEIDNTESSVIIDKLIYFKNLGNRPIEITWTLIDGLEWVCNADGAYYLQPPPTGGRWLLQARVGSNVWMPTDAVDAEKPGWEYGLAVNIGAVASVTLTLVCAQSAELWNPPNIDFTIQFTAYDEYPETVSML